MKVYGYSESAREADSVFPEALAELRLIATAGELRLLAEFLCERDGKNGDTFDHVHLSDRIKASRTSPQFIVAGVRSR